MLEGKNTDFWVRYFSKGREKGREGQTKTWKYFLFKWAIISFFKKKILFIHERQRERGRQRHRGRSRLHAGSPMRDSILGSQDHTLSWKQRLNHWVTQVSLIMPVLIQMSLNVSIQHYWNTLSCVLNIWLLELYLNSFDLWKHPFHMVQANILSATLEPEIPRSGTSGIFQWRSPWGAESVEPARST